MDEADRIALASGCGERGFDDLYRRHSHAVRSICAAIVRNPDAVDDLVQDTFLQVWRHRGRYVPERAPVRAWIHAIARHRAIDVARARHRQDRVVDAVRGVARCAVAVPDALAEAASREEGNRLRGALASLPCDQRRTLVLAYAGGLSHTELALRTGVPLGTVKSRIRLGHLGMARRIVPENLIEAPSAG